MLSQVWWPRKNRDPRRLPGSGGSNSKSLPLAAEGVEPEVQSSGHGGQRHEVAQKHPEHPVGGEHRLGFGHRLQPESDGEREEQANQAVSGSEEVSRQPLQYHQRPGWPVPVGHARERKGRMPVPGGCGRSACPRIAVLPRHRVRPRPGPPDGLSPVGATCNKRSGTLSFRAPRGRGGHRAQSRHERHHRFGIAGSGNPWPGPREARAVDRRWGW